MRKYEVAYCPNCRTEMHITKENRNSIVKCLCGKNFMVISINGKHDLCELVEGKDERRCKP